MCPSQRLCVEPGSLGAPCCPGPWAGSACHVTAPGLCSAETGCHTGRPEPRRPLPRPSPCGRPREGAWPPPAPRSSCLPPHCLQDTQSRSHGPGQPPPPAPHPLLLLWLISPHAACQLATLEQKLRKRSERSAPARPPARGRSAGGGGQGFQEGPQFPSSSRPCRGPVQGGMRHRRVVLAPSSPSSPPPH